MTQIPYFKPRTRQDRSGKSPVRRAIATLAAALFALVPLVIAPTQGGCTAIQLEFDPGDGGDAKPNDGAGGDAASCNGCFDGGDDSAGDDDGGGGDDGGDAGGSGDEDGGDSGGGDDASDADFGDAGDADFSDASG